MKNNAYEIMKEMWSLDEEIQNLTSELRKIASICSGGMFTAQKAPKTAPTEEPASATISTSKSSKAL